MLGSENFRYKPFGTICLKLKHWLSAPSPPQKVCLSIVFGFYLGLFPVVGMTTIFCLLFTFLFRLNPLIVQAVNWLLCPIQLVLIYPFMKLGRMLFFPDHDLLPEVSVREFWVPDGWDYLGYLWGSVVGGILAWFLFSLATGYFLYRLLLQIARKSPVRLG